MRKWLLYIVAGLVGLVALTAIAGYAMPARHVAHGAKEFRASPSTVYDVVTDFAKYPEWRSDVTSVEVGQRDGKPLVTEHGPNGVVPYLIEDQQRPSKFVMRIADPDLPFGGTWTFEVSPNDSGSELVITEDGEVYNPFFRILGRLFMSPTATIDGFLEDLRKRLGE